MRAVHFAHYFLSAVALAGSVTLSSGTANAAQLIELDSVLVIAKSSNRNQVHYAALVNDECAPIAQAPVRPYWRMLERGPLATEPLLDSEQRWLGLDHQKVASDTIQVTLRAMPDRTLTIHTGRAADGQCSSWIGTTIAGVSARIASVYVKQKLFGIDYVLLSGWAGDGKVVSERVSL